MDNLMPKMLVGKELEQALTVLPAYDEQIRYADAATRLTALSDLYSLYIPSKMSTEIYSKLYLALLRSLQKKGTKEAVRQYYANHAYMNGAASNGIIGGADSFTIIGESGIGKSSAIARAIDLLGGEKLLFCGNQLNKVIPILIAQCPYDCSVKGLILELLRLVDGKLGSTYYQTAIKSRTNTIDMLVGVVATLAAQHIGLLIVDEIQNVVSSINGQRLMGLLTQLINCSGISIALVGTPESTVFFESAMQLARRSVGLYYTQLEYDRFFCDFCETVFGYQYVQNKTAITQTIMNWLFQHSRGIVSVVVSLIHDAQEIAILEGQETLSIETLELAYRQRLAMLQSYILPKSKKRTPTVPKNEGVTIPDEKNSEVDVLSVADALQKAKDAGTDPIEALRAMTVVEEVAV